MIHDEGKKIIIIIEATRNCCATTAAVAAADTAETQGSCIVFDLGWRKRGSRFQEFGVLTIHS